MARKPNYQSQAKHPKVEPKKFKKHTWAVLGLILVLTVYVTSWLWPVRAYVVFPDCSAQNASEVQGLTVVLPAHCKQTEDKTYFNAFYYISTNYSDFTQFYPCADVNGPVQCVPIRMRAAFVALSELKRSKLVVDVVFATRSAIGQRKLMKAQLLATHSPLFEGNNLLSGPMLFKSDLQPYAQSRHVHFIVQSNEISARSTHFTAFYHSLRTACAAGNNVTVWLMTQENKENLLFLKNFPCVTQKAVDFTDLCADLPCSSYYQSILADVNSSFQPKHLHAMAKYAILAKYGGWYIDTAVAVVRFPEVSVTTLDSVYENQSILQPACSVCYSDPSDGTFEFVLKALSTYYNPDCYGCLDLDVVKFVYQMSKDVQVYASDVYLPYMRWLNVYKQGHFDNDAYTDLISASNWFWHLRYAKNVNEDVCSSSYLLYSLALEQVMGYKICDI